MLKKAVLLGLMLFFLPVALASTMTLTPVKDQISPYDSAKFVLSINNTGSYDKFVLSYDDLDWLIQTDPLTDYTTGMFIGAGHTYSTTLLAKPTKVTDNVFKKHSLEIMVTSRNTGEVISRIVNVDVRKDLIVYPFRIEVDFLLPEEIFPVKTNSVKVKLRNTNPLNITHLNLTIKSSLFEKQTAVSLEPNAEKIIDFSVTLDKMIPPQEDKAILTVTYGNATVASITKNYSIVPYGKFYSATSSRKIFLGEEATIKFTNTGNSEQTEPILINAGGWFERLFTSTRPSTKVTQINDALYYTADVTLAPEESETFVVKTSYAPILYFIIIIIIAGILYFALRSPIIVAKEAKEVAVEEGGIAKLSVLIKLKNRRGKLFKNVKVVERVPNIAKVQIKESETMKPSKHYNYRDGMVMEYDLGKMEPGEVRFISYHLKTKLAVVGSLRLRPVIVQYSKGKKIYSNPVEVYTP